MRSKLIKALILIMLLGSTGCSSGSSEEKTLEKFEDNGYSLYFADYDNRFYYDMNGNLYPEEFDNRLQPGKKDNELHFSFNPEIRSVEIHGNNEAIVVNPYPENSDKTGIRTITYYNKDSDNYRKGVGNVKEERVYFQQMSKSLLSYIYFFEEDEDSRENIQDFQVCGEEARSDAIAIRKQYQTTLENLDITEDELESLIEWALGEPQEEVTTKVRNMFTNQEQLTVDEVEQKIINADFKIDKLANNSTVIHFYNRIGQNYCVSADNNTILFFDIDDPLEYGVVYAIVNGDEKLMTQDMEQVYNFSTEKMESGKRLSEDAMESGEFMRYMFNDEVLQGIGITLEELQMFFDEY